MTHRNKPLRWGAAIVVVALSGGALAALPGAARAEGLFDFLFGFHDRQGPPPEASAYAEPSVPARPPLASGEVRPGIGSGRPTVFCVRLCDGQHFPLAHLANATPVEACRAMCPAAKTKVFYGSDIGGAATREGERYADLDSAFAYQKQVVPNCTCNGRNVRGLASFEAKQDPTLRPGDIVATEHGFVSYTGRRGTAAFTPVDAATVTAELNPASSRVHVARRAAPRVADDETGSIVQAQQAAPVVAIRQPDR